jgi:hypothetical protein
MAPESLAADAPASSRPMSVALLGLTALVPPSWVSQPPASAMRLAQFRVPATAGSGDAECVVFYFGPGQGGSVEANIARWESQFSTPDGKPVKAVVRPLTVSGMPVTAVELAGRYARGVGMGPAGPREPDQTLLVAIVQTPRGNLFFQLHGPQATVAANQEAFWAMIRGIN